MPQEKIQVNAYIPIDSIKVRAFMLNDVVFFIVQLSMHPMQ